MSQLNNTQLTVVLDKLARFATESVGDPEFNAGFNSGMQLASSHVLSGAGSLAGYILSLADEDIVADLLPPARVLDESNPTPPDSFLLNIPGINAMIKALDTHYKFFGFKGVDDYLTGQNAAAPTLRAHGHFRKYLKTLSAKNSFIPNDLVLATLTATGASTGTYAHLNAIDTKNYAGAKLVVKNVTALTDDTGVSVTAKKLDGTSVVLTASLTTHTIDHETDLSDVTKNFVDVTAIAITTGTSGDQIEVVAKTDRSIASA